MPETTIQTPVAQAPQADHLHRWRIQEPNGPRSAGV